MSTYGQRRPESFIFRLIPALISDRSEFPMACSPWRLSQVRTWTSRERLLKIYSDAGGTFAGTIA